MPMMREVDYKVFGDDMQYVEVELDPGEGEIAEAVAMMHMDDDIGRETGCKVAFQPTVNYDTQYIGKIRTVLPVLSGRQRGEGGIPGNLGGILNGD